MNPSYLITDFTCALPRSAWTDADSHVHKPVSKPPDGLWRIIDYKTNHYHGRALLTTRRDSCVATIPLNRTGWHAVSIGLSERQFGQAAIEVRLTGDEHWQLVRTSAGDGGGPLHEEPWRFADLTGKSLEVRYPRNLEEMYEGFRAMHTVASIYSVRLSPLPKEHVALLREKRHRPMVCINDGCGLFYYAEKTGTHIVDDALRPFADSDWDICCFGNIGGDLVNFPSKAGTRAGEDGWDMVRPGDIRIAENLAAMIGAGQDPMRQAIEKAHAQNQKFWMYFRPQAHTAEPPYDHVLRSRFFGEHPEWRCVEANGKPISKLSFAFPAVRQHFNTILQEALERGADGLCLAFIRGYPCVRYEAPVLERFQQLHGADARSLPDSDLRLRQIWADFMTGWIREVRALLDVGSRHRELAVIVGPDSSWNLRFGFDTARWAKEGLVDAVLPYPYVKDGEINVAEFAESLHGTATQLLPSLGTYAQNVRIAVLRERAHRFYKAGATGLSRWDCPAQLARLRLDDPVQAALWCEHYFPPQDIEMTEFAGQNIEAFGPMLGF